MGGWVGADLGDLDTDGAVVGDGGVPGAFLEVECLVDRAVEVEQEVDREAADVVQRAEALTAGAGDVVVDDELVDDLGEQGGCPGFGCGGRVGGAVKVG